MLRGDVVELRLVREGDLDTLYELMSNLDARGSYFPLGVMTGDSSWKKPGGPCAPMVVNVVSDGVETRSPTPLNAVTFQ